MHQSHNIPWDLIASNFEFKKHDHRFTPPRSGLLSKEKPNTSSEIQHFMRRFIYAIRTFSDTERAKYPDHEQISHPLPTEGNLFSDELKKKYPDCLDDQNQRIEYWIWRATAGFTNFGPGSNGDEIRYGSAEEDLAYVVEILLYENEMSTLIMMAHHPKIPIASLQNLNCGYYFGFSRVMDNALRAYIFFNSAEATNILANGEYTHSDGYKSLLEDLAVYHPTQQTPHHHFFQSCGLLNESGFFKKSSNHDSDGMRGVYVHTNLDHLHEYMKTLFSLLYRYDLLMRECEIKPGWEWGITHVYPINKVIKTCWVDGVLVIE